MPATAKPSFGVLEGIKVVHASTAVAGPFAAQFMAEHGADVVWIENARMSESMRHYDSRGLPVEIDRRNQRTISLDLPTPQGREILLRLIGDADIFIESSKGGQFERWGLDDEVLWRANPRLVILHISGFGLTGDPERIRRPSYDPVAQAFGGTMQLQGFPDRPPITAQPYVADYMTALFACSSALAALYKTQKTGQGESIDLAQYEVMVRTGGSPLMSYLNTGRKPVREGSRNSRYAGVGTYTCADGEQVIVTFIGGAVFKSGLPALGLALGKEPFLASAIAGPKGTPAGDALDEALERFCAARPAQQVDRELNAAGVPCSVIMTYEMAEADSHYREREAFAEWENVNGEKLKGPNVFPRFKRHPGRVWRGAPTIGMDNEELLQGIGLSDQEIAALYERAVVTKAKPKP